MLSGLGLIPQPNGATTTMAAAENPKAASYKDKMLGSIPGAFEQAFQIEHFREDDSDDDVPPEEDDGELRILLTRQEKLRIRAPWRNSLIVKLGGRPLEYSLFLQKLENLWKPSGGMECVDLGNGYYTVTFHNSEDRSRVLRDGPWFINYRFLSIRMWEPKFNPCGASSSVIALWVRLPGLPSEYYNKEIITKIAEEIGPLLRLDGVTATRARANFARLCVQFDLKKPLPKWIWIGEWKQVIQYEGISTLCFKCGIVGHRRDDCPLAAVKNHDPMQSEDVQVIEEDSNLRKDEIEQSHMGSDSSEYGPWILVGDQRRRPTPATSKPRGSYPQNGNLQTNQGSTDRERLGKRPVGVGLGIGSSWAHLAQSDKTIRHKRSGATTRLMGSDKRTQEKGNKLPQSDLRPDYLGEPEPDRAPMEVVQGPIEAGDQDPGHPCRTIDTNRERIPQTQMTFPKTLNLQRLSSTETSIVSSQNCRIGGAVKGPSQSSKERGHQLSAANHLKGREIEEPIEADMSDSLSHRASRVQRRSNRDSDCVNDKNRERSRSPFPGERMGDSAKVASISHHLGKPSQSINNEETGKGENHEGGPMHSSFRKTLAAARGKCPSEGV